MVEKAIRLVRLVGKQRALEVVRDRYNKEPIKKAINSYSFDETTLNAFYYGNMHEYITNNL